MTKFAMTGGNGRIGKYLQKEGVIPLDCDVRSSFEVEKAIQTVKPSLVIHLAAKSNIDYCEDPKNEDEVVYINLHGTDNVVSVSEKYGIPVVMMSSDHVFSGKRWLPFAYSEKSRPNPVNFYGHSKLSAESLRFMYNSETVKRLKIVRTSYLFDAERLKRIQHYSVPSFMYRSFMYIPHFVNSFMQYLYNFDTMPTIVHISGTKTVSWKTFMDAYLGKPCAYHTKDDKQSAPRPHRAGLRSIYNFFPKRSYLDGIKEMQ